MSRELLPVDEALARLLAQAAPVDGVESLPTAAAAGRVLAEPVRSGLDVPPADNTSMDGYALRAADVQAGSARLRVSQRIPAGTVGQPLEAGTAARIFTGALVPPGADAVVMQEQTEADGDHVIVRHRPAPGEWIRRAGEDIRAGSTVLEAGALLVPQALGLAASVGAARLAVRRRVRAACFFTGDELAMPGEPLRPGAIYNSNRFVLAALLERAGCEVRDLGIVPDSLEATRAALREAAGWADLIVTSGGVSVGEEDHVRPAVQAEGSIDLWQIAIKPGKPLAYGRVRRPQGGQSANGSSAPAASVPASSAAAESADAPSAAASSVAPGALAAPTSSVAHFIGLPGNPVSSFVTFLLFVRPFLRRLQGAAHEAPRGYAMRADFDWPRPDRRREFLRVRVNDRGGLEAFPNQSSGVLTSTVWGDGLLDNPAGQPIRAGDTVRFLPFAELL